jgi:hypothetical protein
MGKTLFAISTAALMVSFIAGWAVTDTQARTPAPMAQINTFNVMTSAQQLPTEHFADFTFVY